MGFMAGVWRMLGAEEEDTRQQIVDYPLPEGRQQVQQERAVEQSAGMLSLTAAETVPQDKTIFVVRPELDDAGEANFSLKQYASYLLSEQALVLDVNEVAALDELHAIRIVDYLSGVAEAVNGSVFEVTKNIFIFAPSSVQLAGDPLTPIEVN